MSIDGVRGDRTQDDRQAKHGNRGGSGRAGPYHGPMVSADALRSLPKAELHQHLDGSIRPETAVELAAALGMPLDIDDARRRMVAPEHGESQSGLLAYFDLPIALLQTGEALERVTSELVEDLMHDGVRYAEVRWAPRLHLERGLSVTAVLEAVASGIARAAPTHGTATPLIGLIVTAMRSHPPAANVELARAAAAFGPPILGFDLAGLEAEWPAPPHAAAFNEARDGGLALTAHAGEVPGAQRVREVLDFGIRRVAHGVTAIEDEALLQLLRARDVTLDLCPTSNVQAGIVPDLASHPIAALHRAGVSVTISTDDRTVTGTTLTEEMARTATAVGLTDDELATIALNGFARAFAPPVAMAPLRAEAARAWDAWRQRATSAEARLEQRQHGGRIGGDRVGAPLAGELGSKRGVGHPGQHENRGATGAVGSGHVGIGVVADDDRLGGRYAAGLQDGLEHRRRRLADHLRCDAGGRRQGGHDRSGPRQEAFRGGIPSVRVGRDEARSVVDGAHRDGKSAVVEVWIEPNDHRVERPGPAVLPHGRPSTSLRP